MKKFSVALLGFASACLFVLFACNKDDGYLFYSPPATAAKSFSVNHRISDLAQGNAMDILSGGG